MLHLPPYSPDFSPIEPGWSKLKTIMRGYAGRTREAIEDALVAVMDRVSSEDLDGWFRSCG